MRYLNLSYLAGLIVLALLQCVGCYYRPSSPPVRYVLPNGFRGGFVIRANRPDGATLKQENGWIILRIPENGDLRVNGDPLGSRHAVDHIFADGAPLKYAVAEEANRRKLGADEIAVWDLWTNHKNETWFFVGTEAEKKRWIEETSPPGSSSEGKLGGVAK